MPWKCRHARCCADYCFLLLYAPNLALWPLTLLESANSQQHSADILDVTECTYRVSRATAESLSFLSISISYSLHWRHFSIALTSYSDPSRISFLSSLQLIFHCAPSSPVSTFICFILSHATTSGGTPVSRGLPDHTHVESLRQEQKTKDRHISVAPTKDRFTVATEQTIQYASNHSGRSPSSVCDIRRLRSAQGIHT